MAGTSQLESVSDSYPKLQHAEAVLTRSGQVIQLSGHIGCMHNYTAGYIDRKVNVCTCIHGDQNNTVIWFYFVLYLISYAAVRTKIKRTNIINNEIFTRVSHMKKFWSKTLIALSSR